MKNRNEKQYMTLRELKARIGSTKGIRKISVSEISASGKPVEIYESEDYQILVYPIGFAIAKSGRRKTAVRVDECRGYTYDCDMSFLGGDDECATPNVIPEEYFLDQPWPIRVMMEADDQFQENEDGREQRWLSRHPEIPVGAFLSSDCGNNFENEVIAKIDRQSAMETLTGRQRQIYRMYDYGYTQQEIGEKLGITQSAVFKSLAAARKKITAYTK